MDEELKHIPFIGEIRIPDNVEETRTITFVASTSDKDRHGTVVNQKNWELDAFNKNPIIGYQHDVYGGGLCTKADPDDVIGSGEAYLSDEGRAEGDDPVLMMDVKFEPEEINTLAEKIFRKVIHGTLRAVSVGFLPLRDENGSTGTYGYMDDEGNIQKSDTYFYYGQELLETSIVNIPSNREALKRSLRDQTTNALMFVQRSTGLRFSEIESMTVRDILDAIDKKGENKPPKPEEKEDRSSEEGEEGDSPEENDEGSQDEEKKVPLSVREKELALKAPK